MAFAVFLLRRVYPEILSARASYHVDTARLEDHVKIPTSAFLLIAALLLFAACQTSPEISQHSGRSVTYHGQLRYAGKGNPIIGEVIVRSATADHLQIEFFSGPGFPLMRLQVAGNRGTAEGVIARGRWQGSTEKAPARIAGWFFLPEVFGAAAGRSGVLHGRTWTANSIHSGGRLTRLEVLVTESGETFAFHFGA